MVVCPLSLPILNADGQVKDEAALAVWGQGGDIMRRGCKLEAGAGVVHILVSMANGPRHEWLVGRFPPSDIVPYSAQKQRVRGRGL